jgi:hypothetical protein
VRAPVVALTALLFVGCNGLGPTSSVSGHWTGTWSTGSADISITEKDGILDGIGTLGASGSSSPGAGSVNGTHSGSSVSFSMASSVAQYVATIQGMVSADGKAITGILNSTRSVGVSETNRSVTLTRQ